MTDAPTALTSPTTAGTNPLDEVGECPRPATNVARKTGKSCEASVTSGTLRPKAQLPPHQTALVEPVHSQNGGRGHFVLSWVVPTRRTIAILSIY